MLAMSTLMMPAGAVPTVAPPTPSGAPAGVKLEPAKYLLNHTQPQPLPPQAVNKAGCHERVINFYHPYREATQKFSGEHPEQALDFVADVEEKARTRLMGHEQLFIESAELFAGEALDWHRDAVRRVSNWSQLRQEFLIAYHGYGNDSGLRERIRSCKQTDSQSIDVFLGIMEGMYSRLERPIGEAERLEEILRNLNPFLKEKLVMTPMSSISDLRMYARTAESGRLRMGSSTCVSSSIPSPSPVRPLRREIAAASLAALPVGEAIEAVQSPTREPFSCYNCGSVDHPHRSCPLPRKKFCYRCGLPDVTTFTCTRCNRGQSKND
ncbi:hypothetical protein GE061_007574 [Apolygus lucorum]|uniref:CCHC-type domain-containing protein n=1 Tax=Apolygus lucorum TaxID=248454 RepID=A0A8S9WTZ4_APOLU|nr:hypothetical protein GE061_007574 [Apolygus lucorum]